MGLGGRVTPQEVLRRVTSWHRVDGMSRPTSLRKDEEHQLDFPRPAAVELTPLRVRGAPVRCPDCQHENREGRRFCGLCGSQLPVPCPSCGTLDEDGERFCGRCGAELAGPASPARAVPDRTPRDYTPKHLADKILQSKSALEGERKQVTVLFADVKGSLELAEQVDPEEWHRILDRFFQILADGVHRFEGTVNQYTGDGIMALFGAPIAHEDHAQRACWAALHLRDELRRYADELRVERGLNFSVRMGINSGEVVVGKIGDDLRMDYTAQGQTVGLAARMEELAESGKVLPDRSTPPTLVAGYFELRDLGASRIKGLSEPLHLFELEGVGALRTRLDLSRARGFSKFVGRADELASLEVALERARSGSGQVVGIVGEAGLGKSRLCYEFEETCRARGIPVRHAGGVSHGKAIPLLPILELFRQVLGISARDGEREARQKIAGAVVLLDEELREELPLLFDFLGVPDPERPAPALDAEARQRRLLALLKRYSIARSQREPAVLVFEDLHWIDSATETFVEALADATEGARTLMVVNFRPEYRSEWMHRSYYQQLALRPLERSGVDEMLREWLGDDPSLAGLGQRIFERTEGNPFFIEEVVQSLIESGRLEGARGQLSARRRARADRDPRHRAERAGRPHRSAGRAREARAPALRGDRRGSPGVADREDRGALGARAGGGAAIPGAGGVPVRAGALPGARVRLQARADPGRGVRVAAAGASCARARCGGEGARGAARGGARREGGAAGASLGAGGGVSRGGPLAPPGGSVDVHEGPRTHAAACTEGARAPGGGARVPRDARASDRRAEIHPREWQPSRAGGGRVHAARGRGQRAALAQR